VDYYTVEESAAKLKISKYTVWKYIKSGQLKAAKIGKIYRISESQLDEFMKSLETKSDHD
jgi:excisionase family DNA binding protein